MVGLSDSERSWMLNSGESLLKAALEDGQLDWNDSDLNRFAEFFVALHKDGSIDFHDYGAGRRPAPGVYSASQNDVNLAAHIRVTSAGRVAVASSGPRTNITIEQLALGRIANVREINVLVSKIERGIDSAEVEESVKEEARSRLRRVTEVVSEIGTGTAGDLLAAVLRQTAGLP
jgi:hypothetical protein